MPERSMTRQEMEAYLNHTHIANLATLKRDGSPHLAPVWYEYDGENLLIITNDSAAKVRNINRDSRVMVSISSPEEPYKYALIEGTADVISGDVEMTTLSICTRYRGMDRGPALARNLLEGGNIVVLLVHPTNIITWVTEEEGAPSP